MKVQILNRYFLIFVFCSIPFSMAHAIDCQFASSDPDGDGWGWENNQSCRVTNNSVTSGIAPTTCIDTDGDGWGWDGSASCRVGEVTPPITPPPVEPPPPVMPPSNPECIDTDGDGWGWTGTESCRIADNPVTPPTTPPTTPPVSGGCSPSSGSTFVSSSGPIQSNGNASYSNNGPQCVGPSNQFDGPGLRFGDFLLSNNAWNGDVSTWNWSQCIALTNINGSISPSWDYDWGNEDALLPGYQEWEVKSYPEVIFGVKSQNEISAPCEQIGLPVMFNSMPSITIDYSYRATQTNNRTGDLGNTLTSGGDRNIAIESFLHSSCDVQRGSNSNRVFELMVWLEHGPERLPSGSPPAGTYTDSYGNLYDVYSKSNDLGYIAYVAQNPIRSGTLNWNEFFADARTNASRYGVRNIQDSWCLANILFGSEIWWGQGTFDLDYYQITRQY